MTKILVLYVFHIYNERVEHFLKNCIFNDENVDFIIISNNKDNKIDISKDNVKILYRDNIGYDFGGWSDALLQNTNGSSFYNQYDKFIFVNSSVIGPFLPSYFIGNWTDVYLNGLKNDIKLFGSTINTCRDPLNKSHVQSYIFSMDKITLEYLIKCEIFSITNYAKTFNDAIWQKEVLMSRKILENGWNIGSLLMHYKDVDFRFKDKSPKDYNNNIRFLDDIMYQQFMNTLWNKYELVFIKGNRIKI